MTINDFFIASIIKINFSHIENKYLHNFQKNEKLDFDLNSFEILNLSYHIEFLRI